MKFKNVFRWLTAIALLFFTWVILLDRLAWQKIPTQISAGFTYGVIAINLVAITVLVARPSALGLSTKTDRS